jgi:trimeric autotransporter adhesin
MKSRLLLCVLSTAYLFLALTAAAQQAAPVSSPATVNSVPNLINYSGILKDTTGRTLTSITAVTFLLYKEEQSAAPLWLETQNVQPDKTGHYSVQLGSASKNGIPSDLFTNGEARWLAVQIGTEPEQARVLLVAVPYAMKSVDAQTLGGLPPSAFVLAVPTASSSSEAGQASPVSSLPSAAPPPASVTGSGTANFIPLWTSTSNVSNSVLFQSGTGTTAKIGINTTSPLATLHVKGPAIVAGLLSLPPTVPATAAAGAISEPQNIAASAFNSSTHAPVTETFQWEAEPAGNNTPNPSATLNLRFGSGGGTSETGLFIASNGRITFAPGQLFPNTGTVKSVGSGLGLKGGPITTTGSLSIDPTVVPQLGAASNKFAGSISASSFTGSGAGLSNVTAVNSNELGGLTSSAYAQVGAANTFSQGQTINNSLSVATLVFGGLALNVTGGYNPLNNDGADGTHSVGGDANPDPKGFGSGGIGIYGQGGKGGGGADGAGGTFQGGSNIGGGDGIDAFPGIGALAGFFSGDIQVTGAISAGTKDFKIDHPLDPANKYMVHASIESSEMMNLYTGNVMTDAQGEAVVQLPDWFEAVNRDFRYQLTVIGQFAQAIVSSEIYNHQFTIRTNAPNVKVSWQVTGVRHDAYAKAYPLVVEQEKEQRLKGFYIHPELYGAPEEKQIEWARHPQTMKKLKEVRAQQMSAQKKQQPN